MNNLYEKYKNLYHKSDLSNKGDKKNHLNRWVVSYADFVTVLLAVFIVLYAVKADIPKTIAALKHTEQNAAQIQKEQKSDNLITNKESSGGDNLLLDGVKNPSDSKDIKVIEFEKMAQNLNSSLKGSKSVEVIAQGAQITIRLGEGVLFDEGSAIIKPNSRKTLDILAGELAKNNQKVRIEGHSDNIPIKNGKYSSNWELSTIRATNIVTYLIDKGKIDKSRLSAAGYADNMPVKTNATKEGRAKNRRVDIVIIN